ncbi:transposable element Tcb2 transposase [Trichonephila clavipes]|uniref:Transposable element Tcb2 transposase n=1 Tax=Trichonephila clavipes TaxID=2585209 RepID=A0A8X6V0H0_TRICX|nr:transposable element Tcb2 transposase [Trichonephila clavipes]
MISFLSQISISRNKSPERIGIPLRLSRVRSSCGPKGYQVLKIDSTVISSYILTKNYEKSFLKGNVAAGSASRNRGRNCFCNPGVTEFPQTGQCTLIFPKLKVLTLMWCGRWESGVSAHEAQNGIEIRLGTNPGVLNSTRLMYCNRHPRKGEFGHPAVHADRPPRSCGMIPPSCAMRSRRLPHAEPLHGLARHAPRRKPSAVRSAATFATPGLYWHLHIIRIGELTGHRYRNEILRPIAAPYAAAIGVMLMDGDFRPNRASFADDFFFRITRMEWPACSPDMNPIQQLWGSLGQGTSGTRHNILGNPNEGSELTRNGRQYDRQVAKMTPIWLYHQDFAKFPLNHHYIKKNDLLVPRKQKLKQSALIPSSGNHVQHRHALHQFSSSILMQVCGITCAGTGASHSLAGENKDGIQLNICTAHGL